MTNPVYITKIAERTPQYRGGITSTIDPFDEAGREWLKTITERTKFTFSGVHSKGEQLYYHLQEAIRQRDKPSAIGILAEMEKYLIKSYDEMTEVEKWGHMTVQLPEDWGPKWENKEKLKKIATKRAHGRVLEAMCGFRSYFGDSPKITEVVALDFCEEGLQRYDYPQRVRILYDLEKVVKGEKMDFFEDSSFQTIGVFFGIDYFTDPVPVHKEFHRILSSDGKLLIVGGTTQGYEDMLKRYFKPGVCSDAMKSAGFSTSVRRLPLKTESEFGEYYLVEGRKK